MRHKRQSLGRHQQQKAAQKLCQNIVNSHLLSHHQSQHIAIYLANDGEIDPSVLAKALNRLGKQLYLPSLQQKTLRFKRHFGKRGYFKNRFNILEPASKAFKKAQQLDIIFMPLVAFDQQGRRLGMGGGFYDRALAFKKQTWRKRPLLIGLAHQCQQHPCLQAEPWDIPVDAIATDQAIIWKRN